MMRLLRSVLLVAALVAAGVRAAVRLRLSQRSLPTAPGAIAAESQARTKGKDMQRWGVRIAALLAILAVGGMLVVVSGLVPIKASSGHWRITSWLLHFAMRRSVATHSLGPAGPGARCSTSGAAGCRPLRDRLSSLPRQSGPPTAQDCAADDPASAVPAAAHLRLAT